MIKKIEGVRSTFEFDARFPYILKQKVVFKCTRKGSRRAPQTIGANTPVKIHYVLSGTYEAFANEHRYEIEDTIISCFEKYGDKAANEKVLNKFIKKQLGLKVKIELTKVEKYYSTGFHGGIKLVSDKEILYSIVSDIEESV